nr:MAG TPA: hypothetical protein [Caudoviricetes sp.]
MLWLKMFEKKQYGEYFIFDLRVVEIQLLFFNT